MNVLYDISLLGFGHSFPIARTGIFRVVEHGAMGLVASKMSNVRFCSSQSNYLQCNQYLSEQDRIPTSRINEPGDLLSKLYSVIEPAKLSVLKHDFHPLKNNIVRHIYHAGKKYMKPISSLDLKESQIYHSPIFPIPSQVSKNKNIITFLTLHDIIPLVYEDEVSKLSRKYMQNIINSITPQTYIISVSKYSRDDLCNYLPSIDPGKVFVSHLAAGDHFYPCKDSDILAAVKQKYGIPVDSRYMLALSTLQPRKNFPRTIKCFVNMLKQCRASDLYLLIAGCNGADSQEVLYQIEKAGEYRSRIIMTGYVPDEDLAPLYSGSLAFLYISLYEGFGLPPLEAMQCGTPVITSNNTSLPEVVGNAAVKVDPKDDDAISQAMLDLYSSCSLREKLSAASIERAKLFSWAKSTKESIAAYRMAISYK